MCSLRSLSLRVCARRSAKGFGGKALDFDVVVPTLPSVCLCGVCVVCCVCLVDRAAGLVRRSLPSAGHFSGTPPSGGQSPTTAHPLRSISGLKVFMPVILWLIAAIVILVILVIYYACGSK